MNEDERDLTAEELADLARRLEAALEVEAPDARSQKALFVAGAGARARRSSWTAALVPATAAVAVLIALAVVSRSAVPGQALFPVRQALDRVGLAPSTTGEVRGLLDDAERLVTGAEGAVASAPTDAQELALRARATLEKAEELVDEMDGERADAFDREIDALDDRADDAYDAADDTIDEREEAEDDENEIRDDSSGRGSGGDDDSSGSGSGEDDSNGPGSGDDSISGSDDGGSGSGSGSDDSSGSGSGGDSSGSGSGSGSDDSSGPGSGDD